MLESTLFISIEPKQTKIHGLLNESHLALMRNITLLGCALPLLQRLQNQNLEMELGCGHCHVSNGIIITVLKSGATLLSAKYWNTECVVFIICSFFDKFDFVL